MLTSLFFKKGTYSSSFHSLSYYPPCWNPPISVLHSRVAPRSSALWTLQGIQIAAHVRNLNDFIFFSHLYLTNTLLACIIKADTERPFQRRFAKNNVINNNRYTLAGRAVIVLLC